MTGGAAVEAAAATGASAAVAAPDAGGCGAASNQHQQLQQVQSSIVSESLLTWEKLSPAEFQQLQDYAACKSISVFLMLRSRLASFKTQTEWEEEEEKDFYRPAISNPIHHNSGR